MAYLKFFKKMPSVKGSADLDDYVYGADDEPEDELEEDSQDDEPEEE